MKIQIKSIFGTVLFEHECKDNTIKKTVEEAIRRSANLSYANLSYANLRSADLSSANLSYADIEKLYVPILKSYFSIAPEEGSFIGWKKLSKGMIAKLEIPSRAKRTSNVKNRKCRASLVKTLAIWDKDGNEVKEGIGSHDGKTVYRVGRLTKPDSFDDDFLQDCTNGIHFFITRLEAENY